MVTPRHPVRDDAERPRWQVLTVLEGRITDIRGYDDEGEAASAAGLVG